MTILVVGASGATGKRLVEELLNRGHNVKAIVRSPDSLPDTIRNNSGLELIIASVLELSDKEMQKHVAACEAVASCLGHNLTFKGLFGKPRRLVTDATRRLCLAIKANNSATSAKFVLMNTVANRNRDLDETIPFGQKLLIGILRLILPPQADNEQAAEYLRTVVGQNDNDIEWVAVRPSGLIDEEQVSDIEAYPSPTRSIVNDGQISRINVAHFMADLITNNDLWDKWRGQMPVIFIIREQLLKSDQLFIIVLEAKHWLGYLIGAENELTHQFIANHGTIQLIYDNNSFLHVFSEIYL